MILPFGRILRGPVLIGAVFLLFTPCWAQAGANGQAGGAAAAQGSAQDPDMRSNLAVSVQDDDGGELMALAVVTLSNAEGKMLGQANAEAGHAEFPGLAPGHYTIHVVAEGYDAQKQSIQVAGLHPVANLRLRRSPLQPYDKTSVSGLGGTGGTEFMLGPSAKAQRQVLKIAQALRDNKPQNAAWTSRSSIWIPPTMRISPIYLACTRGN